MLRKPTGWCFVTLWIIYFLCHFQDHTSAITCTCCRPKSTAWGEEGRNYCIDVSCKDPSRVLAHLEITSGNSEACGLEDKYCFGLTPVLMGIRNHCYWQSQCSLPFPKDRLIPHDRLASTRDGEDPFSMCLNEKPFFIRVTSAGCAKASEIYDVKGKKTKGKNRREKRGQKRRKVRLNKRHNQGIIRSHPGFPWAYNEFMFDNFTEYNIELKWRRKFLGNKVLVVGVRMLDVCETEQLTIQSRDLKIGPLNGTHNNCAWNFVQTSSRKRSTYNTATGNAPTNDTCFPNQQLHKRTNLLKVVFRGSYPTKRCEGFLVCFKVYSKKNLPSEIDVCHAVADETPDITEQGIGTPLCMKNRTEHNCCCPGVRFTEKCKQDMAKLPNIDNLTESPEI